MVRLHDLTKDKLRTYIDMDFATLAVIDRISRILIHDALLALIEPFARSICPPLFEFGILVV